MGVGVEEVGFVILLLFVVHGLEEVWFDLYCFLRRRRQPERERSISRENLLRRPEKPLALLLVARREQGVIRSFLEETLASLNYANYEVFVGVYPDDRETRSQIERVREKTGHVHVVVCPTDVSDRRGECLNWVLQGVRLHEEKAGVRFQIFAVTDSRSSLHPQSLQIINQAVPRADMVQLPVLPVPGPWTQLSGGHFVDEYAERQARDLTMRAAAAGSVPGLGTGTALSREAVLKLSAETGNQVFNVASLTPGYDLGVRLMARGLRQAFLLRSVEWPVVRRARWTGHPRERVNRELIAVRLKLPATFREAVRLKGRLRAGICLQGWEQLGWFGSRRDRYFLFRDRKPLLVDPLKLMTVVLLIGWLAQLGWRWQFPGGRGGSDLGSGALVSGLATASLALVGWRLARRTFFVGRLYGVSNALISPARQLWAVVINALASLGALLWYVSTKVQARLGGVASERSIRQPSLQGLRTRKRRIGELLLREGLITGPELETALQRQGARDLPLGTILLDMGVLSQERLLAVLGRQRQMAIRTVDPFRVDRSLLRQLPRPLAIRFSVFPLEVRPFGQMLVATCEFLSWRERQELELELGRSVEICLASRSDLAFAIHTGYEQLRHPDGTADGRLARSLGRARALSRERLRRAQSIQRRSYSRLGDVLLEEGMITATRLRESVRDYVARDCTPRLGEFLVTTGRLPQQHLDRALAIQRRRVRSLREVLLGEGDLTEAQLEAALSSS